jgi:hypothetical protein
MTSAAVALGRSRIAVRPISISASHVFGLASYALYLALGAYLAFGLNAFHGDAYSRVANAYYVLFSRDPHLAAMGFVWMPLPSLFELVLLPAKAVFPGLVDQGFAAVIMSATFMALAVATLDRILVDLRLGLVARLALVGAFALNPMILYYGSIGTSEAPTLFFALLACRYLIRYVEAPTTGSLVGVGIALAGGYLTRYEAAAAPVGVAALIVLISLARVHGTVRERLVHAGADIAIALTPFVLVFVAWAAASWLIVGAPFSQFSSDYGNSSMMAVWAAQGANEIGMALGPSIVLAGVRLTAISVALPVALLAAGWALLARRDWRVLAVGSVIAPMVGFMVLVYVVHIVAPWLRYFILVIPLAILLVALAVAPQAHVAVTKEPEPEAKPGSARLRIGRLAMAFSTALLLGVVAASVPVAGAGMLDRTVAVEEARDVGALLAPGANAPERPGAALRTFAGEWAVAEHLDALNLERGTVLMDVFSGFAIVMHSQNPQQFVITPDRDFQRVLSDPALFGVRYLLVPSAGGNGILDAVNRAYPRLATEETFATEAATFPGVGTSSTWTLYEVVQPE